MFAKKFYSLCLIVALSCSSLSLLANSWRILFYMDSSDSLSDMAFKNITDMVRGKPNDSIELFIQLHAYYNAGLRYRVTNQGLVFLEEVTLTGNNKQDFIDAASWGFSGNNADHTMMIMSNHGWGILDPRWNEQTQKYEVDSDQLATSCTAKRSALAHHQQRHKGYMFNHTTKTYLTNDDLISGLNTIKDEVLSGQQIDIVAFDTCMGAMLEVAYQVAPFARYMVGSQSCSLPDGFDYQGITTVLNQENNTPLDVAAGMVNAFDDYYTRHDDSGIYTHTAFDLNRVDDVRIALNLLIEQVLNLPDYTNILNTVRDASPRFCMWPMYTDTMEFFTILGNQLAPSEESDQVTAVMQAIEILRNAHATMIVARCGGSATHGMAHGSAIYCPFNRIDSSYNQTLFAGSCQWINLLQAMCTDQTGDSLTAWSVGNAS
ncbi:MAG: clostripain-related cysteine peptidase [Candidatus Dependentiae bacterium]|nr:clostripain-related cysteine peptidase [Candidatus Dependentiae bacterium]